MFAASARSAALSAGLGRRAASTIAQKYSSAVFSAALNKSPQVLNKVQSELNAIHSAVKSRPELSAFISNPTLSTKDRAAGLPALYAAAGKEPVSDITKNLFVVLSENGRLVEAEGVIEGFNELVAGYKGELNVTITSAAPLPRDIQTRLETLLKQSQAAQQAKSLKITNKVNPTVLGGVVVDFGDKTIDLSVASRVNKLNNLLSLDLTANLASILRRYPFGIGLFREIIQNSDDAKARTQIFVLDHRQHPRASLIRPALSDLQGPALLAYNDTTFTDADWHAIRTVSQSSKIADTEKIGKHGLGSRAYYHLTDNPQYLSGDQFVIFDPHRWAFEHGGWKESLDDIVSRYEDQLVPFRSIIGDGAIKDFSGTVVRLALRSPCSQSRISTDQPSPGKIHDLLVEFIQQELHMIMLFLTHLTSIVIREIDEHGRETLLATAFTSSQPRTLPVHTDPSGTFKLETRNVSVTYNSSVRPATAAESCEWAMIQTSFPNDECVKHLSGVFGNDLERVRAELAREKLRSNLSIAFPVFDGHGAMSNGRLFTFLPLPLETGFPCHIHGVFSLTDSRQNMRNPSETVLAGTADAFAVAWNQLLFSTFIPRAWLVLLESVAAGSLPLDVYNLFPPLQDRMTSGDAKYWTSLLHDVIELALARNAVIWPVLSSSASLAPADIYASMDTILIARDADDVEQLRMLVKAGVVLMLPPARVSILLLELQPQRMLTPESVRPKLTASATIATMQQDERNHIIEFLLQTQQLDHLIDVPVILLVSGDTVALLAKGNGTPQRALLTEADAELFGPFDSSAVALQHLPSIAKSLLVNEGSRLNVVPLHCVQTTKYIQAACSQFSAWSWEQTRQWLGIFWEWVAVCPFADELLQATRTLALLPTTTDELRTTQDPVFFYPRELDNLTRDALSRLGISFLHPSISPAFFEQHRPKLLKSASSASDLLQVLQSSRSFGEATANILRAHLSRCLTRTMGTRLSKSHQALLRDLPIHPIVIMDSDTDSVHIHSSSLPPSHPIYCLADPEKLSLPLPRISDAVFVHRTLDEQRILEQIDYQASISSISTPRLLQLHVEHIEEQPRVIRVRVLRFLVDNRAYETSEVMEKLRASRIVPVGTGDRLLTPQDVIDPQSHPISELVPPGDPSALFDDGSGIACTLMQLGFLRRELDVKYVGDRIRYISNLPEFEKVLASDAARRLLHVLEAGWFNCSGVGYDPELSWIPTKAGLKRPEDTRDTTYRLLCDRVMPMLDLSAPIESKTLRRMLGWDQPIPYDILAEQLRRVLSEPLSLPERSRYLTRLTREFGRRFPSLVPAQIRELATVMTSEYCVPTEGGELQRPRFVVFKLSPRLRGFGQVSPELLHTGGVEEFLLSVGCTKRHVTSTPSNASILQQLEGLAQETIASEHGALDCIDLLQALDYASITEQERSRIVAPGNDNKLRKVNDMFYNDLGSRAHQFALPEGKVGAHSSIRSTLRNNLQIPSLGSFHLKPLTFFGEDMREDLTTRIANVLRAYDIDQAFNEFLANATDAGATTFNLMLDKSATRYARSSDLLCEAMVPFCQGPALVVHNDALFTEDDIRGICRIGRGGKEGQADTIGRFGLGALSCYHFSEVVMILSGRYLVLLDPSGRFFPDEWKRNSYVTTLSDIRSLYPGHLQVFSELFGFHVNDTEYRGTMIRLPLRTHQQASKSSLINRSLNELDMRDMLMHYNDIAVRSLFFIRINDITAAISTSPTPLWTVSARRSPEVHPADEPYTYQDVVVTEESTSLHLRAEQSWRTFSTSIASSSYPDWASKVLERHRVKCVSIALAGQLAPSSRRPKASSTSKKYFFSSLPLPIMTTLPMHVHASFILADDRRNIRWDGDGTLNEDSKFNHWLLSSMIPQLYLFAIATWNVSDVSASAVAWPGSTEGSHDPLSDAVVDAFYGSNCLASSPREVFRSLSDGHLSPSFAVVRSPGEPEVVKAVLRVLRPDELVELPTRVRSRVLKLTAIRRVDPEYMSYVINRKQPQFVEAYRSGVLDVNHIQALIRYILSESEQSSTMLVGLPLLPLADKVTLSSISTKTSGAMTVFSVSWTGSAPAPWDIFPAQRFLHPSMDQNLLLDKGLNIVPLTGQAIIDLLQDLISPAPRLRVTAKERDLILRFWEMFSMLLVVPSLDDLSKLPLIPTMDNDSFISLDTAVASHVLGIPLSNLSWLVPFLRQLGAEFVPLGSTSGATRLPSVLLSRLSSTAFTFQRAMAFFRTLYSEGRFDSRLRELSENDQRRLAEWIRSSARSGGKELMGTAARLPIWLAYQRSGTSTLRPLTDPLVRLVSDVRSISSIVSFLKDGLFFVDSGSGSLIAFPAGISVSRVPLHELGTYLEFPTKADLSQFRALLEAVMGLKQKKRQSFSGRMKVPNEALEFVDLHHVYSHNVPQFRAAFAYRRHHFIHTTLRSYQNQLVPMGLQKDLNCKNFIACARAIEEDFSQRGTVQDQEHIKVIFQLYSTQLPLVTPHDSWWRGLDTIAFIPQHASRRIGTPVGFDPTEFASPLPYLVSPSQVLRHEHSAVAWTQRVLFAEAPDRRLAMADASVGVPYVGEVVEHLRVLALEIAPRYSRDRGLLDDLKATYAFLNERYADAKQFLLRHGREALFLNVSDPSYDKWNFCAGNQIMFNVPDEDGRQDVRAFLRPFRNLLLAGGAEEIKIPTAPVLETSPAEDELARMRGAFSSMRQSMLLTDVNFMVAGSTVDTADRIYAHRNVLAAASEHFHHMFCGHLAESGPASAENPIVIELPNERELQCARLILDHVYTGHFEQSQERECLLNLMQLAHRWELADVQRKAEVLLIPTITPGTFLELRDYAEEVGATLLLAKVDEFKRENASALEQMIEWD
ncbi:hypothetical protein C8Q80DRAFT_1240735 [Daedaleopsis nitida]|nr:hypothetical protein C8Q80DRAFT_1240735 [Daedaleopsis nitida]